MASFTAIKRNLRMSLETGTFALVVLTAALVIPATYTLVIPATYTLVIPATYTLVIPATYTLVGFISWISWIFPAARPISSTTDQLTQSSAAVVDIRSYISGVTNVETPILSESSEMHLELFEGEYSGCIVALNRHKNRFGDRWFLSMRSQEDYDNCCRDIQAAQYLISGVNLVQDEVLTWRLKNSDLMTRQPEVESPNIALRASWRLQRCCESKAEPVAPTTGPTPVNATAPELPPALTTAQSVAEILRRPSLCVTGGSTRSRQQDEESRGSGASTPAQ